VKRFHRVRAGKAHEYSLILSIGKARVKEVLDEYQEQRKELAQRTNSTKDAISGLKEQMRVKREELSAVKNRLLAELHTRFAQLAQNFLPPIARTKSPSTPYYSYYDYKDVNGYLKRGVESFEHADVTVDQIEVLKQFVEETNFEETSPEKWFESVQRIIAKKLGLGVLDPVKRLDTPIERPHTPIERPHTPIERPHTPIERPHTLKPPLRR
jgi:hypothetical protein